jgi:hypothetical protein
VVAAQAVSSGQIAVALASGAVELLQPQGDSLTVSAQLQPQGGIAALPSSIDVLKNSSGNFNVLVGSQGSDTVFVYAVGTFALATVAQSGGALSSSLAFARAFPTAAFSPNSVVVLTTEESSSSSTDASAAASTSSASSTSSVSSGASVGVGMSLGGFSSLAKAFLSGATIAMLVAVEGNSYLSVPVLDFGSEHDEEASAGAKRMPALASKYPIADNSPLWRFVVGIEDALREYRRSGESARPEAFDPAHDPWNEDLFRPRRAADSRAPASDRGGTINPGNPAAIGDEPPRASGLNDQGASERLDDRVVEEAGVDAPGLMDRVGAGLGAVAGLAVAAFYLMPPLASRARQSRIDVGRAKQ